MRRQTSWAWVGSESSGSWRSVQYVSTASSSAWRMSSAAARGQRPAVEGSARLEQIAGELEDVARVAHGRPRIHSARFSAERARSIVGTGPSMPCAPRLRVWKVSGNVGSAFLQRGQDVPAALGVVEQREGDELRQAVARLGQELLDRRVVLALGQAAPAHGLHAGGLDREAAEAGDHAARGLRGQARPSWRR